MQVIQLLQGLSPKTLCTRKSILWLSFLVFLSAISNEV